MDIKDFNDLLKKNTVIKTDEKEVEKQLKSVKKFSDFGFNPSENLKFHLENKMSVLDNVFRPGSEAFYELLTESRKFIDILNENDRELFQTTDLGEFAMYEGELVPLDLPMEDLESLYEAEYKGREVELNKPTRSSGPKKYKVYVKNPKTGRVKVVNFGDVKGGLTAKISDPKARSSFAKRHKCHLKKDRTTPGFWSCRLTKFPHLFSTKKTYSGFW